VVTLQIRFSRPFSRLGGEKGSRLNLSPIFTEGCQQRKRCQLSAGQTAKTPCNDEPVPVDLESTRRTRGTQ
jgi:hypothetical protein